MEATVVRTYQVNVPEDKYPEVLQWCIHDMHESDPSYFDDVEEWEQPEVLEAMVAQWLAAQADSGNFVGVFVTIEDETVK